MKRWFIASLILSSLIACQDKTEISSTYPVNWEARTIDMEPEDSLIHGTTYLSVYSQIYSQTEHTTHDLTATVSMKKPTCMTLFSSKWLSILTQRAIPSGYILTSQFSSGLWKL
jgi:hypothetical protein